MKNTNETKFSWLKKAHKYYESKQYQEVIFACDQALQIDEAFDRAHLGKALAFYNLHAIEKSVMAINQTINCNPRNVKAYILRGDIYSDQKKYERALMAYNQALIIDPNDKDALQRKKQAAFHLNESKKRQQRQQEVISTLPRKTKTIEEIDNPILKSQLLWGDKLYKEGKYKEALEVYAGALVMDPENQIALKGKAKAHTELGQYIEAKEAYDLLHGVRVIGKLIRGN